MTPKRMTKEEFLARWQKDQEEKAKAKRKADTEYAAYIKQCINKRKYKWRKINDE